MGGDGSQIDHTDVALGRKGFLFDFLDDVLGHPDTLPIPDFAPVATGFRVRRSPVFGHPGAGPVT
jgi:hypothetical protein